MLNSDIGTNSNATIEFISSDEFDNIVNLLWSERMIVFIVDGLEFAEDGRFGFIAVVVTRGSSHC